MSDHQQNQISKKSIDVDVCKDIITSIADYSLEKMKKIIFNSINAKLSEEKIP
jgi:hypothetical protein